MTDCVPVFWFLSVAAAWIATSVQSHRLLWAFTARFPEEAKEHIPSVHTSMRDPEKLSFFLRKGSIPILQRDPRIWRMRQRLIALMILSMVIPPVGLLAILVMIVPWGQ